MGDNSSSLLYRIFCAGGSQRGWLSPQSPEHCHSRVTWQDTGTRAVGVLGDPSRASRSPKPPAVCGGLTRLQQPEAEGISPIGHSPPGPCCCSPQPLGEAAALCMPWSRWIGRVFGNERRPGSSAPRGWVLGGCCCRSGEGKAVLEPALPAQWGLLRHTPVSPLPTQGQYPDRTWAQAAFGVLGSAGCSSGCSDSAVRPPGITPASRLGVSEPPKRHTQSRRSSSQGHPRHLCLFQPPLLHPPPPSP